jgi:hypothetical protein
MPRTPAHPIRLDDLIAAIVAVHTEPLDQLSDAVLAADHLDEVADHLIGHFVDRARRSGASWSEIGRSMGVTKQAAQKRFTAREPDAADGFARFTEAARNALVAAHDEARAGGATELGAAHLALGLLAESDGTAARAVEAQGVSTTTLRRVVAETLPAPVEEAPELVPYDARARKVLELAVRESLRLAHDQVGTGHVLLALVDAEEGAGVLTGLGLTPAATEQHVRAAEDV